MSKTYKIIDGVKGRRTISCGIEPIPEEDIVVLNKIQCLEKYNDEIHGYGLVINLINGLKYYLYEEESVRDKYFEGLQDAIEHMDD